MDKTHITCSLTPQRKSSRVPKVILRTEYKPERKSSQNNTKEKTKAEKAGSSSVENSSTKTNRPLPKIRKLKVLLKRVKFSKETTENNTQSKRTKAIQILNSQSENKTLANNFEQKNKVLEETDGCDDDEEVIGSDEELNMKLKTPILRRLRRSFLTAHRIKRKGSLKNTPSIEQKSDILITDNDKKSTEPTTPSKIMPDECVDDLNVYSFYERSFTLDSPTAFDELSSPIFLGDSSRSNTPLLNKFSGTVEVKDLPSAKLASAYSSPSISSGKDTAVIVTPLDLPPLYEEVLQSCEKFEIYEFEFQKPFYSNPDDITKQKEVGYTVLQIPGNKLNDSAEFQSVLGAEAKGLTDWRRKKLLEIGGPAMLNHFSGNTQHMREYFASKKRVTIAPQINAPSRHEAKLWLKARELLNDKSANDNAIDNSMRIAQEDSPIKIRRKKVTMMFNDEAVGGEEDADCSIRSLTLTPMTPGTPLQHSQCTTTKFTGLTVTPLSAIQSNAKVSALKRRPARRAKVSLHDKLIAVSSEVRQSPTEAPRLRCIATERLLSNSSNEIQPSQNSVSSDSSICSQAALAEMERATFIKNMQSVRAEEHDVSFGLSMATLNNTFGFKVNLENLQEAKSDVEYNYLTTLTLEVFVPTRGDLYPNPEFDEIRCIFYAVENSIPRVEETLMHTEAQLPTKACGYIIVNDCNDILKEGPIHGIDEDIEVQVVPTEVEAIQKLLELCARWDPDIYAGYEIEMGSWGYVLERAKALCLNIAPYLSRVPTQKMREFVDEDRDQFTDLDIEMKLCGRILLDVWRLMRSEIALTSYTFENVLYHILHKRCPWHCFRDLTTWFASSCSRWIVLEYYLERVRGTLALLDQLDLIGRTSEMAKLIGIQFYEVLSRGSQFRVESMMLRIAKPKNLVPLSPSVQQRAHMRAPEYLALIMEPESRFYADPVIVLDFQSLYPSMIIAYNYCFSTCLGRVEHLGQTTPFEFGASQLRVSPQLLRNLLDRDLITISPCGVVFVKSAVREGILPRMLTEILDTRQMVKQSMKLHKSSTALQRILHSRQLGLKLMANVTYGYTAANFSGRMPSVEVGDTVVSKGRETLERAIKMVEDNDKWKVKVVYGDTDSMFVQVPGRNRAQAFKIGEEIAEAVTKSNPHPVKLKLEKVYQPCILQTKKRYVGYMYETADQAEPVYEAKGIETVRRDGCPAVAKMLEKVLRILFETADVSQIKYYVCRQFTKLLSGRANLQDLIFAKEFRGLNGYKPTAVVPALELTRKWIQTDPRRIPRCGERVPFIITNGPPGIPLFRLVRSPHDVLANEGLKINAIYYITKAIIPPLNRCLLLIGADVNEWFANLPRKLLFTPALSTANELVTITNANHFKKSTISQYFSSTNCIIDCGRQTKQGICMECSRNVTKCFITLHEKIGKVERAFQLTQQICQACCGRVGDLQCASLDCPVLYVLEMKRRDLQQITHFRNLLEERF